jgi:hypothetical protein
MELVRDPQLINNLKLNILTISKRISEVELLFNQDGRQLLVCLELSWLGKKFFKNRIVLDVETRIKTLLPNFRVRVVTEREILNLALEKVKGALSGGPKHGKELNPNPESVASNSEPVEGQ